MRRSLSRAPDAALRDQQDHHTSVFVCGLPPVARYDDSGGLSAEPEWTRSSTRSWASCDHRIWFSSVGMRSTPSRRRRARPRRSPSRGGRPSLRSCPAGPGTWRSAGFGYERWVFYPVDEPGIRSGALIDILEQYARAVKDIDPRVRTSTDPYRGMTVADHKRLVDGAFQASYSRHCTSWCSRRTPTASISCGRPTRRTDTAARAHVKDEVTPAYYWEQIWTAWSIGFTGIGYWTHCTTGLDLWDAKADWVLIYSWCERARSQRALAGHPHRDRGPCADGAAARSDYSGARRGAQRGGGSRGATPARRGSRGGAEAHWDPGVIAPIRQEVIDLTVELKA